jgi:tetratricopeptide (TPR) repeat protein
MRSGPKGSLCIFLTGIAASALALADVSWAQEAKTERNHPPPAPAPAEGHNDLLGAARKVREGRIDEALEEIKRQSVKHPEWSPPRLILARLMLSAGQAQPGRLALERAAIEAPDNPEVYLAFGTLALGDKRFSDARLNFEHVLSMLGSGGGDAEKFKGYRGEAHAGLVAAADARDDWATALRHLNALLELDPNNGQARQRLGRVLFHLGKSDEAYKTLLKAVKNNPALEPAAVSMGWLFSQTGDAKKAQEWFDYALKVDSDSARSHMAYAAWLLDQGRIPAARPEIEQAVKLDPTLKEAQRLRALVAWYLRDLTAVEQILEPLHRDAPSDSAVANLLALALIDQDDKAKQKRGQELAEVNVATFPRSHEILATLGWAYYRAGRIDDAVQKLRAAVQRVRTTPDIAYFYARALADKGQTEDARKLLESATKLPGAFAHRVDADALLKSLPKANEQPAQGTAKG